MSTSKRALLVVVAGVFALSGACKKEVPDQAGIHREAGNAALADGDWKKAADEFTKSLEADPKQEKIWEKKAYAHLQAGELDAADAAILKTTDFMTESVKKAEVYRNLGNMYVQKNTLDKAEKYYLEALKLVPDDDSSLGWMAEIYSRRGGARHGATAAVIPELEKALAYYDKLIALKPDQPLPYVNKRIALIKIQMDVQAKKKAAEDEAVISRKDKEKVAAAKASAEVHQARIVELQKQIDEVTAKLTEVQKTAKPK